ncbi:MAG: NAD(P)H-binding protein [Wenyingzhuangia sp.]|uniref:NAD(P)H-binding protein n=1 Tax=Wenyingzhuangia sp. TaxID=1964193 RepID=UPI003219321B
MKKSISILGCGWLGLPLAKSLVDDGFTVKGSTTTTDKLEVLLSNQIQPYVLNIEDKIDGNWPHFIQSEILLINIPFRRQKPFYHTYKSLIKSLEQSSIKHVIFVSSTAVYAEVNREITSTENFKVNPAKKELIDFETLFKNNSRFDTTVIRFAGLIGGNRNPGHFFKDDRIVKNGLAPVNLIHLEDCIGIIKTVLKKQKWNVTYNAVASTHPSKKDFYELATTQLGKKPAIFKEELDSFKIISNQKTQEDLNYVFVYPDLLESLSVFRK